MNIFALEGHKVICSNLTNGYEIDKEIAKKYLIIGEEYTIKETIVHDWSTSVFLKEFPNISFNSVFFKDVNIQSINENKKTSATEFI